jgi:hypothetical protein
VSGNWLYTPVFITTSSTPVSRKANQSRIRFELGKDVVQILAAPTEHLIRVGGYSAIVITPIAVFYSCHGF